MDMSLRQNSKLVSKPTTLETTDTCAPTEEAEVVGLTSKSKRLRGGPAMKKDLHPDEIAEIKALVSALKADQDLFHSKIISDIDELKQQYCLIQKSNKEVEKAIEFFNNIYDDIKAKVENIDKERLQNKKYIACLEKKIEDLELSHRPSTFEIRNYPIAQKETHKELVETVMKIAKIVNIEIDSRNIRDIYRISTNKGFTKTVAVELNSVPLKNDLIIAMRAFNKLRNSANKLNTEHIGLAGERLPIYVDERLPGRSRRLFFLARQFTKQNNYKFCWSINGRIYIRKSEGMKPQLIKSEEDLCLLNNPI